MKDDEELMTEIVEVLNERYLEKAGCTPLSMVHGYYYWAVDYSQITLLSSEYDLDCVDGETEAVRIKQLRVALANEIRRLGKEMLAPWSGATDDAREAGAA